MDHEEYKSEKSRWWQKEGKGETIKRDICIDPILIAMHMEQMVVGLDVRLSHYEPSYPYEKLQNIGVMMNKHEPPNLD